MAKAAKKVNTPVRAKAKAGANGGKATVKTPAKAAAKNNGGGGVSGLHTLREDNPWAIDYAGHVPRADSPLYVQSRKLLNDIAKSTEQGGGQAWFYGPDPWEDHHGGGLWVHDGKGWFFVKNFAGMEWASQFCADPAKVEMLRKNAQRLYQGTFLTNTKMELLKLDARYPFDDILNTQVTTSEQIAQWCDSIFNASVPLPKLRHTGAAPKGHGVHHYPTPVTDIELFKRDDFTLWVLDGEKQPAAVVPVHPRGVAKSDPRYAKHYGETAVAYATPNTKLAGQLNNAVSNNKTLFAGPQHSLSKQAFSKQ
jgi:uncharacterized protein DUF6424